MNLASEAFFLSLIQALKEPVDGQFEDVTAVILEGTMMMNHPKQSDELKTTARAISIAAIYSYSSILHSN